MAGTYQSLNKSLAAAGGVAEQVAMLRRMRELRKGPQMGLFGNHPSNLPPKSKMKQQGMFGAPGGNAGAGEGSRGGKVVGHTTSGKPIYDQPGHPSHSKFNAKERQEAEVTHAAHGWEKIPGSKEGGWRKKGPKIADGPTGPVHDYEHSYPGGKEKQPSLFGKAVQDVLDGEPMSKAFAGLSGQDQLDALHELAKARKSLAPAGSKPKGDVLMKQPGESDKKKDDEEEPSKPGESDYHRDQALAHLTAAQAHANAHASAKQVEAGKEHGGKVKAAEQATQALMVKKGGLMIYNTEDDEIAKSLEDGGVIGASAYTTPNPWGGQRMQKGAGEGSRGGHVVGHTKGGRAVYEAKTRESSIEHHADMMESHREELDKLPRKPGLASGERDPHAATRAYHNAAYAAHRDAVGAHNNADGDDAGTVEHAHKLSRHADAMSGGQRMQKGAGEGSRGGKVIGHTKSGKPIYSNPNHPEHAKFSAADHHDAYMLHGRMGDAEAAKRRSSGGGEVPSAAEEHHFSASDHHDKAWQANPLAKSGTIYQGEADGQRGGDYREEMLRTAVAQDTEEQDPAGNRGQGGLPAWFADSYNGQPQVSVPTSAGPSRLTSVVEKGYTVIDDDDPYTRQAGAVDPRTTSGAGLLLAHRGRPSER